MVQDTILEKSLGNFLQGTEKLKKGVFGMALIGLGYE
jgi:hypothetical protein|tara:strand:- start:120 stop:230 length:111 start_codon:yes stop_codon:yes gene_type:complete